MVVAAGTTDRHPEESLARGTQDVIEILVPGEFAVGRFIIPDAEAIKAGGGDALPIAIRQQIPGQLLLDEPVVRLVPVKGADDIVAIFPD